MHRDITYDGWSPTLHLQNRADFNNPDSKVHGANKGPSGSDRTQFGPILAPWTLLSGKDYVKLAFQSNIERIYLQHTTSTSQGITKLEKAFPLDLLTFYQG